jgi:hypothetical protein
MRLPSTHFDAWRRKDLQNFRLCTFCEDIKISQKRTSFSYHTAAIMDATTKKRKLSKPTAAKPSQKRRKVAPQVKSKRPVAIDKLQWKTVDVPEMFDDAEGFYGLEEVEGVDIVRDGETIKFVSSPLLGNLFNVANLSTR